MTVAAAAAPSMFAVFRRRDFSLLWLAQLVSTAGSALTDLAAGIYVWRATESALAVGLTLIVTAIPSLVVGLLAGVYVDRHDRKRIMIVTCLIQAVTVGLIAVVIGIDAIALPGSTCSCSSTPASSSSSILRTTASSRRSRATRSSRLRTRSCRSPRSVRQRSVSPGPDLLAGSVGLQWAFIIDAASFVFAAGCIALMGSYAMPKPDDDASVAVIVEQPEVRHDGPVRDPDHPVAVRRRRLHVLLVRSVERPAPAVHRSRPCTRPNSNTACRRV